MSSEEKQLRKKLGELNEQIHQLTRERTDIVNDLNNFEEEEIKSLKWVRHCRGVLTFSISAYGLCKYQINLYGVTPLYNGIVWGGGKETFGMEDIHYAGTFSDPPAFQTNSSKLLISFLEAVEFESFDFCDEDLSVLEAAKKKKDKPHNR